MSQITATRIELRGWPPLVNEILGYSPNKVNRLKTEWKTEARWAWKAELRKRKIRPPIIGVLRGTVPSSEYLYDADATSLAYKWALDACVNEGGLPDDNRKYVLSASLRAPTVDSTVLHPVTIIALACVHDEDAALELIRSLAH